MRREWTPEDLIASWTLVDADWALVGNKGWICGRSAARRRPLAVHRQLRQGAPARDRRLVRQLGALLPLADGLDLDHSQLVEAVTIVENIGGLALELRARDEPKLRRWAIGAPA